ncbi:unnamed protein product [Adineta steineri]|uniref:Uncharacterized protein n=1 Tax=Adineta steineri TaxID=433720 RepID=A0A818JR38_9BILA|nr:unnamed protein product [Adineta steineri]CAF3548808.1 unnamed protein product [Adineta steineri]
MDEQLFFSSTSSSLFDTYLVYGIIGLLTLIAIIGLIILLSTSCCCCYCCLSPTSCYSCYFHKRRHSTYKVRQNSKHPEKLGNKDTKPISFIRRKSSDIADFSQLYDSCPHLINSKLMTPTNANMDTSCTTIDTLVSPVSPCSSFRSVVVSGAVPPDNKTIIVQNDLSNLPQKSNISIDKTNKVALSTSAKGLCSRPFSYIKNTNDRTKILRRLTQQECSIPADAVSIDVTRINTLENDNNNQINSNSTNIYETVLPTTPSTNNSISSDITTPIYEKEWTHNLRQLMMPQPPLSSSVAIENEGISIIELPSPPPDLISSTKQSTDYFQQQNPYDKFLSSRSTTSDSMRRANMLRRLKDDAAFLY